MLVIYPRSHNSQFAYHSLRLVGQHQAPKLRFDRFQTQSSHNKSFFSTDLTRQNLNVAGRHTKQPGQQFSGRHIRLPLFSYCRDRQFQSAIVNAFDSRIFRSWRKFYGHNDSRRRICELQLASHRILSSLCSRTINSFFIQTGNLQTAPTRF